jgi:hypothetical protein
VGPRAGLDAGARRKIFCYCRGSNPDFSAHSQTLYCLSYRGKLVNLPTKIKTPIFVYFFVCELNKIFRNLCICLLCTLRVFFMYCFEVQIVEMA